MFDTFSALKLLEGKHEEKSGFEDVDQRSNVPDSQLSFIFMLMDFSRVHVAGLKAAKTKRLTITKTLLILGGETDHVTAAPIQQYKHNEAQRTKYLRSTTKYKRDHRTIRTKYIK